MKNSITSFNNNVECVKSYNLHENNKNIAPFFPDDFENFQNKIIYGVKGIGKYSQTLYHIQKYSERGLRYEKKLNLNFNKQDYTIRISDIHFEINMELLGCNSKVIWNELYRKIVDIIYSKPKKVGIIVCRNFHEIQKELLDSFYSYMQENNFNHIKLKYILLTESVSFIPDDILNACQIIRIRKPTIAKYNKLINYKLQSVNEVKNIYELKNNIHTPLSHVNICNNIIENILDKDRINLEEFREVLYELLIYNVNMYNAFNYIIKKIIERNVYDELELLELYNQCYRFFKYYNNNYRPIYHLEQIFLKIKTNVISKKYKETTTDIDNEIHACIKNT